MLVLYSLLLVPGLNGDRTSVLRLLPHFSDERSRNKHHSGGQVGRDMRYERLFAGHRELELRQDDDPMIIMSRLEKDMESGS